MAQVLQFPNAIAEQNKLAASSTFEVNPQGSIGYRSDSSLEYKRACQLEAARANALSWAVAFSEGWRSGRIVFSDDGVQLMHHIVSLIAETEKLIENV